MNPLSRVHPFERDAPPEVRALMEAYREATGLPVTLTVDRCHALLAIASKPLDPPLGPADVKTVIFFIRRKMADPKSGFGETSLDFRKVLGDADLFEERALKCRQAAARKVGARPRPQESVTDASGATRLLPGKSAEPQPGGKLLANVLREIADKAEGRQP